MTNLERRRAMSRMKRIEEAREERFRRLQMLESTGQRITDRPTNRPYDSKEDVLIQKREERKIKAVAKANEKYSEELKNEINSIFNDINDGIEVINTFNYSHDDNEFKIQRVEIPLFNWYDRFSFGKNEISKLTWDKDYDIKPIKKDEYPIFELEIDYFEVGLCLCDPYKSYNWENTFTTPIDLYDYWEEHHDSYIKRGVDFNKYFKERWGWTVGCVARFNGDWDFFDVCLPDRDFVHTSNTLSNALLISSEEAVDHLSNYSGEHFYELMFRKVNIELPNNKFGLTVAKQFNKGKSNNNIVSLSFDKDIYKNIKKLVDVCE